MRRARPLGDTRARPTSCNCLAMLMVKMMHSSSLFFVVSYFAHRGGIPIIFPQFSDMGSLTKHGFARTAVWELRSQSGDAKVTLALSSSAATRQVWPHDFEALYRVAIVPLGGEHSVHPRHVVRTYWLEHHNQMAGLHWRQSSLCSTLAAHLFPSRLRFTPTSL